MRTKHRLVRRATWCSAIALLACGAMSPAFAAAEEETISAVYKAQNVDFFFRSSNSLYPCFQIENRVANILRALGARDDIKVSANGCESIGMSNDSGFDRWDRFDRNDDPFRSRDPRREQTVHIRAQLMMPVKVTPEILAEIDRDKSRRELISRVTGNPAAAMNDAIVFAAKRQEVTLSRRTIRLDAKDCELLDEMSTSVFRKLNVRVVRRSFNCDRGETSRIPPQLTAEALLPIMMTTPPPGAGQPDPEPAEAPTQEEPAPTSEAPAP